MEHFLYCLRICRQFVWLPLSVRAAADPKLNRQMRDNSLSTHHWRVVS